MDPFFTNLIQLLGLFSYVFNYWGPNHISISFQNSFTSLAVSELQFISGNEFGMWF